MKLFLIIAVVGAAAALPHISEGSAEVDLQFRRSPPIPPSPLYSSESSSDEYTSYQPASAAEVDLQFRRSPPIPPIPLYSSESSSDEYTSYQPASAGIRVFQYSHPSFVQTYKSFKHTPATIGVSAAQTYTVPAAQTYSVPSTFKYSVPSIKAVGFTPLFTTDDDDDDDIAAIVTPDSQPQTQPPEPTEPEEFEMEEDVVATAEALTYSRNLDAVPSYAASPTVYAVSAGVPAVGHVSTIPITQYSASHAYTGGNLVYSSASPTVYSGPNVYSTYKAYSAPNVYSGSNVYSVPTVYSAPGVYNSHPFFDNSQSIAPAVTKLLTSPQHVASYVIRKDD